MAIRLFVQAPLEAGALLPVASKQAHYLTNVMRRRTGDEVLLFDGRSGQWRARLDVSARREVTLEVLDRVRAQSREPGPTLHFAPLKRARQELMVEKATELGVALLQPVLMHRSVALRVNLERLHAIAVEAAEQCGRLTVPTIEPPVDLAAVIAAAAARAILWADEAAADSTLTPSLSPKGEGVVSRPVLVPHHSPGAEAPLDRKEARPSMPSAQPAHLPPEERDGVRERPGHGPAIPLLDALRDHRDADVLIGPEGGFDPHERALLLAAPGIVRVSLGPRILRAETAALAALACWQATRLRRSTA